MAQKSSNKSKDIVAEEIVAVVGNNTIMLSDLEQQMERMEQDIKANGTVSSKSLKAQALELLLTQKLLASKAFADSMDKDLRPMDDRVNAIINNMVTDAGSIRNLERKMGKALYQLRADIGEQLKEIQMAQDMENVIRSKVSTTTPEVISFYDKLPKDSLPVIPQQYTYAQIVMNPPDNESRKYEIREKLLGFRQRILNGERFSTLATLYSQDRGSAIRGGEIGPQPLETFVKPFAEAAESLKPGQVSEIVETEFGFHIIEMISLKDGMAHLRHILLTPEFTVEETQKAVTMLDSLATEIRKGSITFEDAALKYSHDKNSKMNGGIVFNINPYYQTGDMRTASNKFLADELEAPEYRALSRMKKGDISNSFESTNRSINVYKIIKLVDIIPSHTAGLKYDYDMIESAALADKQNRAIEDWINRAIKDTYIYISPNYRDTEFERKEWLRPYRSLIDKNDNRIE